MDTTFHLDVADAVLALERLPGGVADLVVLDPGVSGRQHKLGAGKRPKEASRGTTVAGFPAERWPSLLYEVMRVLAPGRVCWWVCESSQAFVAARAAERMGFSIGAPMVWDRGEHQAVRLGFVLPLTRGRPRSPGAELVSIPRPTAKEAWPGELPEGLCRALIEAATEPGELVVDPFCGSGALGAAANLISRRYLGVDLCELAIAASRARIMAAGGLEVGLSELLAQPESHEIVVTDTERAGSRGVGQLTIFSDAPSYAQRPA